MRDGIPSLVESLVDIVPFELRIENDLDASPTWTRPTITTNGVYAGFSRIVKNAGVTDHHAEDGL